MAKIGNEARLILKLAAERADRKKLDMKYTPLDKATDKDFKRGFRAGLDFYELALKTVVAETEK